MSLDLLCMGEPMLELNRRHETAEGEPLYLEGFGGDTSNAAIAAARQGARSGYITALGQDGPGEQFMALWRREGVDATHIHRDKAARTGLYLVTHGPEGHEFQFYRAGSAASRYTPDLLPRDALRAARMFYASGISLAISTSAADAVFEAIRTAREAGVTVAFDTNYRASLWPVPRAAAMIMAAVAQTDIALPGLDDTRTLIGLEDPDAILDHYLRLGPKIVVLKMGSEGTYLATAEGRVRIPPFPCKPVDATGAGDTFCGSFLARILAGDAPEVAARYAACAAALSTEGYGAVAPIPSASRVRAALQQAG
ncbi:sugar kinase [Teichococcus vastitatis]|jgi:2-dehydro-3-deoxygluconokinase|uniref:Sugar kinase n=1 Tax=Teichococcus vastitatis TaxID=2307076 RepID=A0ABS9W729_9PROT|nr:sugar kinase [Pseudoroseomonas vastitatis]MCI0755099.1 sugar kinase [Pseudoroseomonas vastitatis]